jgi:hypothetical protein
MNAVCPQRSPVAQRTGRVRRHFFVLLFVSRQIPSTVGSFCWRRSGTNATAVHALKALFSLC